jgi:hypothetical protein
LQEEYTYYNAITRDYRTDISDALRRIFANWYQPVPTENYAIKELQYIKTPAPTV